MINFICADSRSIIDGQMIGKLSKTDFQYFLFNSKEQISYIFEILDDKESLEILSFLFYEPASFKTLKVEFSHIDKETLSGYLTKFWDFGLVEINKKGLNQITKLGKQFLEVTVQLALEFAMCHEIKDSKMRKILVQKIGEKELKRFKKDRQEKKAMGIQLGIALSFRH